MLNLTFYGADDSYENFPQQEELHIKSNVRAKRIQIPQNWSIK